MERSLVGDDGSSPANYSEESGDSEDVFDVSVIEAEDVYDDRDAESCSGGDEGSGFRDGRQLAWREWLAECASGHEQYSLQDSPQRAVEGEEEAMAGSTVDETEANRLFWEACLADGY